MFWKKSLNEPKFDWTKNIIDHMEFLWFSSKFEDQDDQSSYEVVIFKNSKWSGSNWVLISWTWWDYIMESKWILWDASKMNLAVYKKLNEVNSEVIFSSWRISTNSDWDAIASITFADIEYNKRFFWAKLERVEAEIVANLRHFVDFFES